MTAGALSGFPPRRLRLICDTPPRIRYAILDTCGRLTRPTAAT